MEGRDGKHSFQVQFKLNLMAACRVSLESIRMRLDPLVYDIGEDCDSNPPSVFISSARHLPKQ